MPANSTVPQLVAKIPAPEMGLEEACIQPLTRNFHEQILCVQELATAMNFLA